MSALGKLLRMAWPEGTEWVVRRGRTLKRVARAPVEMGTEVGEAQV